MNASARINADSFEWLPRFHDRVQLILTDPPYNFDNATKWDLQKLFEKICLGTIIVFSPPENQWSDCSYPDQFLFWEKPISTKNTSKSYSRFVEMIFVYHRELHKWKLGRHWSQYTNVFKDIVDRPDLHSFRKPPSLIERLILNHTDPGDTILDPFAGSFVVADVADRLGRYCISIEKDKELFERFGKNENNR